jgi:hypothetical protein
MLDRINAVRWSEYAQPQWNKPGSVVDALSGVARGEASAYDAVLYAVGNNHAGTYYPVVLPVMPFLEEMVDTGNASSQRVALDVLLDLFGSFRPEPGYEEIDFPAGGKRSVEAVLEERMHALRSVLERIVSKGGSSAPLAVELLSLCNRCDRTGLMGRDKQ